MATTYTSVLRLRKPDFRNIPWSSEVNSNWDDIDDVIVNALRASNTGVWANATLYEVGRVALDNSVTPPSYWMNSVEHTSAAAPTTFEEDRVAKTDYWSKITFGINPRGVWANDTYYAYYDVAYDPVLGIAALCVVSHTSSSSPNTIEDDEDNWEFLIDLPSMGVIPASDVSFNNSVAGLAGSPANVQTAMNALDALVDDIGTSLTALIATVDDHTTSITADEITLASHTGSLTSLDTRLDAAEADIDDLQARMTQAEADILDITDAFEAGTNMVFWQASAPLGWTKQTTHNDKAMRVVSGTSGGGNGGTYAFSTVFSRYQVDSHTITLAESAYHAHTSYDIYTNYYASGQWAAGYALVLDQTNPDDDHARTTSYAGSNGSHVHPCEMRVAYMDVIICSKN